MGELVELAKRVAGKYRLDPALVCAVCEQESEWRPWAVRMEPAFYAKYTQPMTLSDTEEYTRAISWGLMQVMGETARECGYDRKFLSELCDPEMGLEFGCRKLLRSVTKTANTHDALLKYNGGGNPKYAEEVLARMDKYK